MGVKLSSRFLMGKQGFSKSHNILSKKGSWSGGLALNAAFFGVSYQHISTLCTKREDSICHGKPDFSNNNKHKRVVGVGDLR